jgi:hypothetical protein
VADAAAAVTEATPWSDFVTCTEQLPVASVVHALAPTNVAPPSAVKFTSTPAAAAPSAVALTVIVADEPASTFAADEVTASDGIGDGDGLGDGDGDALGEGDALGDGDGDSLGDGDVDGLGEGDALGDGDGDSLGDGEGDSLGDGEVDGLGDGDSLGDGEGDSLGDGDGDGDSLGVGDGDSLGDGDGDGDSLGEGDVDGLGEGDSVGDGSGVGDGLGDGSSARSADPGTMRLYCFGAIPASVGEGAGVGDALGDAVVLTQNVPSLDHQPVRPFRSTPGMSSDIGGAVRAGAGMVLTAGAAVGAAVAVGGVTPFPTITGVGAVQSSGCTTVSPVLSSYWMIRTPDSRAHAFRLSWSTGVSVIVYKPRSGSVSFASRRGSSTTANRSPFSGSIDQRSTFRLFLPKYDAMSSAL